MNDSLLPIMNFLFPADWFLDNTYFPSFDRSLTGVYAPEPGVKVPGSTNLFDLGGLKTLAFELEWLLRLYLPLLFNASWFTYWPGPGTTFTVVWGKT